MSRLTGSRRAMRRGAPLALLALVVFAQVTASAGVPVPGGGPPAPVVTMHTGGDQYVNSTEQTTLMVRIAYNTTYLPPITQGGAKIVGTLKDTPTCASGAPYSTPTQTSTTPQPGGYFMVGPFDVSSFPDGIVLCAIGFVRSGSQPSAPDTSNLALKDTTGPLGGSVVMIENFIADGYLNLAEAGPECCIEANWSHSNPSDVVSTKVWFEDSTSTMTTGCGVWTVGHTGFGAVNSVCANSMAEGQFSFIGQWFDIAGNPATAVATLIKDTLAPDLTVEIPGDGDQVSPSAVVTASGTADPGATLEFFLDGVSIGTGTVNPDGTWEFSFTSPSGLGMHSLEVVATDGGSNTTSVTVNFEVTDLIPIIILPVEGGREDGTVTIYGRGRPASFVEVFEGSVLIGSVRVATDGFWTMITGLPDGPHAIRARGYDSTIASTFSPIRNFTVDAGRPTVTITTSVLGPAPLDIAPLPGVIEGTATDGLEGVARVRLEYVNLLGTRVLAEDAACTLCGPGGTSVTWDHEPALDLPGLYFVTAQAYDLQGNTSIRRTIKALWVA